VVSKATLADAFQLALQRTGRMVTKIRKQPGAEKPKVAGQQEG